MTIDMFHLSFPISFLIHHQVFNKSTTMGATSGAGTAYPKEAHELTPGFCEILVLV